jgi:hypothetical protein
MTPSSNEPEHEIKDSKRNLSPWAAKVLRVLRPLSMNKKGTLLDIMGEWVVIAEEDNGADSRNRSTCTLCRNDGLRHIYTIRNKFTNHLVESVGSVCIKQFMENAEAQIQAAHKEMLRVRRKTWIDNISCRSNDSGDFVRSVDDHYERTGAISPMQLLHLVITGSRFHTDLPIGVYTVKLQRGKYKNQMNDLSPADFERIRCHLTPAQQARFTPHEEQYE